MLQRAARPFDKHAASFPWTILAAVLLKFGELFSAAAAEPLSAAPDAVGFQKVVAPFVNIHCVRCHGPAKQEGHFRIDQHLKNEFTDPATKGKWSEVVNVLNSHEMPPEGEPQPKPEEVAKVVDWITEQMVRAELVRRDGQIVLRRLNRDEYRNTIRDLIGIDFDVSPFPLDPPAGGFDNNGKALTMSPLLTELYLDAARKILDQGARRRGSAADHQMAV